MSLGVILLVQLNSDACQRSYLIGGQICDTMYFAFGLYTTNEFVGVCKYLVCLFEQAVAIGERSLLSRVCSIQSDGCRML